jgi:2-phosphosulfolactate phosphatase
MNIRILQLLEGAKQATGLTVIIDVFRAFSTACYAVAGGAARIIPVGEAEHAYSLKKEWPDAYLVGERGGVMLPGFDFGNSPSQMRAASLQGRTILHTTSAGTQGIVSATGADEIITGSFVNAQAIVDYILMKQPETVSLVCMGLGGVKEADEDTLCAEYLRNALEGRSNDFDKTYRYLRQESKTGSFLDLIGEASAPKEDFDLCLAVNAFDFVLRAAPFRDDLRQLQVIHMK